MAFNNNLLEKWSMSIYEKENFTVVFHVSNLTAHGLIYFPLIAM